MSKKTTQESIAKMKERLVADLTTVRSVLEGHAVKEAERVIAATEATRIPETVDALARQRHAEVEALVSLETFIAVSLRVMAASRPSVVASAMRTTEIQARIDGKHIFE